MAQTERLVSRTGLSPASVPFPPEVARFAPPPELSVHLTSEDGRSFYAVGVPESLSRPLAVARPHLTHALHEHPQAPVIRSVLTFLDRTDEPVSSVETFVDVATPYERVRFAGLARQQAIQLRMQAELGDRRFTRWCWNRDGDEMRRLLNRAVRLAATIPPEDYDFEQAMADVLQVTSREARNP
jgi:hypothetical protein